MKEAQLKAAKSVERALNKAGRAGLTGGVFASNFCLWPGDSETIPPEMDFFEKVAEIGMNLSTPDIHLDGGAGN
ncbi:hypothetical protein LCGC14_2709420 [marine sediment metagenome]|uniref:Uncharacterized protein n=1 Tax=marine sediment metagenome TaxID=412755 RepID=A0A0F8ZDB1_9ZZZZ